MDLRDVPYWKLSYEERMQLRAQRRGADPALQARLAERAARLEARSRAPRLREIWGAICDYDRLHAAGKHRVRGIGHAAARAGF